MNKGLTYLKVKEKSLSEEARIIRREEYKATKNLKRAQRIQNSNLAQAYNRLREGLYIHRTLDVRNECRATHLARAFLKGVPYKSVEKSCKDPHYFEYYIYPRLCRITDKYSTVTVEPKKIDEWLNS